MRLESRTAQLSRSGCLKAVNLTTRTARDLHLVLQRCLAAGRNVGILPFQVSFMRNMLSELAAALDKPSLKLSTQLFGDIPPNIVTLSSFMTEMLAEINQVWPETHPGDTGAWLHASHYETELSLQVGVVNRLLAEARV